MKYCILLVLIVVISGCATSTSKVYVREDGGKISEASITNKFTELGFNCAITNGTVLLDGPLNRDVQLMLDSNKIQIHYSANLQKYPDYIYQIIESEKGEPLAQKSHLLFHGLTWLSPGIGMIYEASDSIFWEHSVFLSSVMFLGIDGYCVYSAVKYNSPYMLIPMAVLRVTFSVLGDSFITYDNNILSLGYKIKF